MLNNSHDKCCDGSGGAAIDGCSGPQATIVILSQRQHFEFWFLYPVSATTQTGATAAALVAWTAPCRVAVSWASVARAVQQILLVVVKSWAVRLLGIMPCSLSRSTNGSCCVLHTIDTYSNWCLCCSTQDLQAAAGLPLCSAFAV